MNSKTTFWCLLSAGCIAGLGLGWSLGKRPPRPAPPSSEGGPAAPASALLKPAPERGPAPVSRDYSEVAEAEIALRDGRDVGEVATALLGSVQSTELGAEPAALALIAELTPEEARELLPALLASSPPPAAALAAAVGRWAEAEPEAALAWAGANLGSTVFRDARRAAVLSWVRRGEPAAARDWLLAELEAAPKAQRYMLEQDFGALTFAWAQRDPAAALGAVIDAPDGRTHNMWYGFAQLAADENTRGTALSMVLALDDETARSKGISTLVGAWSEIDPAAAAGWLDEQAITDQSIQWSVAQRYANADPAGNADWLLDRTPEDDPALRARALSMAIGYWVRAEPAAVEEWLRGRGLDGDESAAGQLAAGWATRDPGRAVLWLNRIGDDARRTAAAGGVLFEIQQGDRENFDLEGYAGQLKLPLEDLDAAVKQASMRL